MARIEDEQDGGYAVNRVPGRFYVHSRFPYQLKGDDPPELEGRAARFALQVNDASDEVVFESDACWELEVRRTPTRQQLKALFFEDTRRVHTLAFQRFNADGTPRKAERFVVRGDEVDRLIGFLALVQSSRLDLEQSADGLRLVPSMIRTLLGDEAAVTELVVENPDLIKELIRNDVSAPDVLALARRRSVLEEFRILMSEDREFSAYQDRLKAQNRRAGPEAVWQDFLENNPWILGVGSAPQFLHRLDTQKLEQTTVGQTLEKAGKRPDAVLRSAGAISSIALVEIKHHKTDLLQKETYRSDVYAPGDELAGGIAQCQHTVDETILELGRDVTPKDVDGYDLDPAMVCRPRSILVAGHLRQFLRDGRLNAPKFRSFERLRRSLRDPEIVTFDELLERATLALDLAEV